MIGPVHPTYPMSRFFADMWMLFPTEDEYFEVWHCVAVNARMYVCQSKNDHHTCVRITYAFLGDGGVVAWQQQPQYTPPTHTVV